MNVSVASKISGDHLVFRLRAALPAGERDVRSLHIGILLDNSGSMEGERLAAVKRTLHAARPLLRFGDRLTLVTFSDRATVCLRATPLTDEAAMTMAYAQINQIRAETSTNLSAGIEALYGVATDYDAVILLTDGVVNVGITSTSGLRAMAQAGGPTLAFHTIGYGADHNRTLLREMAVSSRGTYTYADSEEILPLAVGDILSGLRAEVVRGVRLRLPSGCGWASQEVGAENQVGYYVGHMMANRDYWAVFRATGSGGAVAGGAGVLMASLETATVGDSQSISVGVQEVGVESISEQDVEDQVMRARVSVALEAISSQLEASGTTRPDLTVLRTLQAELEALPPRPLLIRLRAQVAEALDLAGRLVTTTAPVTVRQTTGYESEEDVGGAGGLFGGEDSWGDEEDGGPRGGGRGGAAAPIVSRAHIMARMSSGAACLANQRGVYSMATADGEEDTNTSFFSTPTQRTASSSVRAGTQIPPRSVTPVVEAEEDADAPAEPLGLATPSSSNPSVPTTQMEEID